MDAEGTMSVYLASWLPGFPAPTLDTQASQAIMKFYKMLQPAPNLWEVPRLHSESLLIVSVPKDGLK